MEPQENVDVFGAEGPAIMDRAAGIGRFVIAAGLFVVGLVLLGHGISQQDSSGAWWFVGGIISFTMAFALPLSLSDHEA